MMEENYPRHRNGSEYHSKRKKPFVKDRLGQRYASDKVGNQLYPNSEKPFAKNKNNEEYYARDFQENEMYPSTEKIITHERIIDPDKYSSLLKVLRITANIFRFVNSLREKDNVKGPLAAEELSNAEIFWLKVTQNDFYTSEITCLKSNKTLQLGLEVVVLEPFPG
ncbi:integrase catalytic domain-containing protein [Trichonephila clavipes]|nr:integrase catalytic domain-containing protein [Trichonephila clavipes]